MSWLQELSVPQLVALAVAVLAVVWWGKRKAARFLNQVRKELFTPSSFVTALLYTAMVCGAFKLWVEVMGA